VRDSPIREIEKMGMNRLNRGRGIKGLREKNGLGVKALEVHPSKKHLKIVSLTTVLPIDGIDQLTERGK
jgi:hypothetical protein